MPGSERQQAPAAGRGNGHHAEQQVDADDLADAVERQLQREFAEQLRLAATHDHAEGVRAVGERRPGEFTRS